MKITPDSITLDIHPLALALIATLMCTVLIHAAHATEVYKWTDADGKVHFGDRKSAPSDGKQIDVKVQPQNTSTPSQPPDLSKPQAPSIKLKPISLPVPASPLAPIGKSKPVDPSKINPVCQDLADKISKVPPGTPWGSLIEKFNANCPGITYECNTYRTQPEKNKCTWVERIGQSIVRTTNQD